MNIKEIIDREMADKIWEFCGDDRVVLSADNSYFDSTGIDVNEYPVTNSLYK